MSLRGGFSIQERIVDVERDQCLYCLSVNHFEDRPPGEYVFFHGTSLVKVRAYEQYEGVPGQRKRVATFRIFSVDWQNVHFSKRPTIMAALREALTVLAETGAIANTHPTVAVNIEFIRDGDEDAL